MIAFSVLYNFPRFFEYHTEVEVYEKPCTNIVVVDGYFDPNCTEEVRNISLIARPFRMDPVYIAVSKNYIVIKRERKLLAILK